MCETVGDVQLLGGMGINSGERPQVSVFIYKSLSYSAGNSTAAQLIEHLPLFYSEPNYSLDALSIRCTD